MAEKLQDAGARRLGRFLPALFTFAALAALGGFLAKNHRHIAENYALHPRAFLFMASLIPVILSLQALANKLHFGGMGVNSPLRDWFRLVSMNSFTNYLPLSAGLAVKALFLKRVHKVPYRTFAVGQAALFILFLSTTGIVGLVTLAVEFPGQVYGIVGAGFAITASSALLLLLPAPVLRRLEGRWFRNHASHLPAIRRSWIPVAILQAGSLLTAASVLKISFESGPAEVGFAACLIFTAAGTFTRLVVLVPGALGIRELVIGGLAYIVGFDFRDALIASTLSRAAEMAVIFLLGSLFTFGFSRRLVSTFDG